MVHQASSELSVRYEQQHSLLSQRNQHHALKWWPELDNALRAMLLDDLESIDWSLIDGLIESHVRRRPDPVKPKDIRPVHVWSHVPPPERQAEYHEAIQLGRSLLRQGKVAAFTVAGGQGTRLGIDGPKGAVCVSPFGNATLFDLFAGMVKSASLRHGVSIPWLLMTSPANHQQTIDFFRERHYFGLSIDQIRFFAQGMLPAFEFDGKLILEAKHRLAMAPDGHGGSLKALVKSGSLVELRTKGVEIISYFQVDNPLVQPFDPLFIGLHAMTRSDMSTKVVPKADDLERVGNVCLADGRTTVIEYSDLSEELARAKNPDGSRMLNAGNIAIHLLNTSFVDRVVQRSFQLPFRRADKAIPFVDESGQSVKPTAPNGVKLETFVFDVLPLANNPLVLEVNRKEEFSPVKNATGVDSLVSSQEDQVERAYRWLEATGLHPPRGADGKPLARVFIAPSFALEAADVIVRRSEIPAIAPGSEVVLA